VIRKIGKYELRERIGRGGMGTVFKAYDPELDRSVAIKIISDDIDITEEMRARFIREAQACAKLSHPNIVTIYDAGEHDGTAYIAMELLRGRHLVDYCCASHALPSPVAIEIIAKLAGALHYAHRQGVVHRDIKPANVMYDAPSGELKITDFGIARLTDAGRTRTGIVLGTPSYMSPEQLEGRPITGQSDLYSLAVTLFQLLTGQLPFRADSMLALMMKIAQEPPPRFQSLRPDLPAELGVFFDRALAKEPVTRFEDGSAFQQALRDANAPDRS
jgi:serine/threonine-protein kinase